MKIADRSAPIPADIEAKMCQWRSGFSDFPREYVEWNRIQALAAKEKLLSAFIVHVESMVNDGWGDGMRFLQLIVEEKRTHKLSKIRWADNQRWYSQTSCGGWILFEVRQ